MYLIMTHRSIILGGRPSGRHIAMWGHMMVGRQTKGSGGKKGVGGRGRGVNLIYPQALPPAALLLSAPLDRPARILVKLTVMLTSTIQYLSSYQK